MGYLLKFFSLSRRFVQSQHAQGFGDLTLSELFLNDLDRLSQDIVDVLRHHDWAFAASIHEKKLFLVVDYESNEVVGDLCLSVLIFGLVLSL